MKELVSSAGEDRFNFPLWKKILAGGVSGGIGAALANPTGAEHTATYAIAFIGCCAQLSWAHGSGFTSHFKSLLMPL